jgi:cell division transport system permease protein
MAIQRVWVYHFKNAFLNILNNRLIHAVSIGTISVSLLFLGAFILSWVNLNAWVVQWGQSVSMSVYLKEGVEKKAMEKIESALKSLPGSEIRSFISREKAWSNLMEMLGSQAGLLDGLTRNPLPASYEVLFREVARYRMDPKAIKEKIEKMEGVDEVQYSEQWLERLEGVIYILKLAGLIIGALLCGAVLFIISNTIRLTIYSRRDEIEIQKLVGATDWFVKAPYMIEGCVQGVLGGAIAFGILLVMYSLLPFKTIHLFGLPMMDIIFLPRPYILALFCTGFLLGLLGSFIAITRSFRFENRGWN